MSEEEPLQIETHQNDELLHHEASTNGKEVNGKNGESEESEAVPVLRANSKVMFRLRVFNGTMSALYFVVYAYVIYAWSSNNSKWKLTKNKNIDGQYTQVEIGAFSAFGFPVYVLTVSAFLHLLQAMPFFEKCMERFVVRRQPYVFYADILLTRGAMLWTVATLSGSSSIESLLLLLIVPILTWFLRLKTHLDVLLLERIRWEEIVAHTLAFMGDVFSWVVVFISTGSNSAALDNNIRAVTAFGFLFSMVFQATINMVDCLAKYKAHVWALVSQQICEFVFKAIVCLGVIRGLDHDQWFLKF
jgi:hypothetical protein